MAEQQSACDITDLPDVTLVQIFRWLPKFDLCMSVQFVCKRFKVLCFDRDIWTSFAWNDIFNKTEEKLFKRLPLGLILNVLRKVYPFISSLDLGRSVTPSASFLRQLSRPMPRLRYLTMAEIDNTEENIHEFKNFIETCPAHAHIRLGSLLVRSPETMHVLCMADVDFPIVDEIQKPTGDWSQIAERCKRASHVRSLGIGGGGSFMAPGVLAAIGGMRNIRELNLVNVSVEAVLELAEQVVADIFEKLLVLQLSPAATSCYAVGRILRHCGHVRDLTLQDVGGSCLTELAETCKTLYHLHLDSVHEPPGQPLLSDIIQNNSHLKTLALTDVVCDADTLTSGLCSCCPDLRNVTIEGETCPKLELVSRLLVCCLKLQHVSVGLPEPSHVSDSSIPVSHDLCISDYLDESTNYELTLCELKTFKLLHMGNKCCTSKTLDQLARFATTTLRALTVVDIYLMELNTLLGITKSCTLLENLCIREWCSGNHTDDISQQFMLSLDVQKLKNLEIISTRFAVSDSVIRRIFDKYENLETLTVRWTDHLTERNGTSSDSKAVFSDHCPSVREPVDNTLSKLRGKNSSVQCITAVASARWKLMVRSGWGDVWRKHFED